MIVSVTVNYQGNGPTVQAQIAQITCDTEIVIECVAPANATKEVDVVFKYANMRGFIVVPDQPVTLKTNSTSAPDNTLTLAAKIGAVWGQGNIHANPITADVTKLYFVNATANDANIKIRIPLVDGL